MLKKGNKDSSQAERSLQLGGESAQAEGGEQPEHGGRTNSTRLSLTTGPSPEIATTDCKHLFDSIREVNSPGGEKEFVAACTYCRALPMPEDLKTPVLIEALQFYAKHENHHNIGPTQVSLIYKDWGAKARAALSQYTEKEDDCG